MCVVSRKTGEVPSRTELGKERRLPRPTRCSDTLSLQNTFRTGHPICLSEFYGITVTVTSVDITMRAALSSQTRAQSGHPRRLAQLRSQRTPAPDALTLVSFFHAKKGLRQNTFQTTRKQECAPEGVPEAHDSWPLMGAPSIPLFELVRLLVYRRSRHISIHCCPVKD
jgi:hypothetical protein